MKLELLVSTLNQDPKKLIKKMNIQTDAIIVCQCDKNFYDEVKVDRGLVKIYYFNERGVGLSRNCCLDRSSGDILLFVDDDEILVDNYDQIILNEFNKKQKYDIIFFNLLKENKKIFDCQNRKVKKFNSLKYGTASLCVKRNKVLAHNIHFSLLFGPGSKYCCGEDSIFIYDALSKGFKAYASDLCIATLDDRDSSWFKGYNEKYYYDKGALFRKLHGSLSLLFCLIYLVRHKNEKTDLSLRERLNLMKNGSIDFKAIMR